jgi:hypothetical protein
MSNNILSWVAFTGSLGDSVATGSTLAPSGLVYRACMSVLVISCVYTMHVIRTPRYPYLVQSTDTLN